ncbi:MAG TPA: hypothetical protein VH740_08115 [Vicinamibacterales bacterium]
MVRRPRSAIRGPKNIQITVERLRLNALRPAGRGQVPSGDTDINMTFDPGGRIGQIVWRVNW